jgi:hypothetical protein
LLLIKLIQVPAAPTSVSAKVEEKAKATTGATATTTEEAKKDEPKPVKATLSDGTNIEIAHDGTVSTVNDKGEKSPAPDGVLTLKDGVTITIKGGKKISQ